MKARDLMTPEPHALTPGDDVIRAAQLMRDLDVGLLPVVDDLAHRHPTGVITDRDIIVRCLAEGHSSGCRVGDHMTMDDLAAVDPEADVRDVVGLMERQQVRRILVIQNGRLAGIIAQADLARKQGPAAPLLVEEALERISTP